MVIEICICIFCLPLIYNLDIVLIAILAVLGELVDDLIRDNSPTM